MLRHLHSTGACRNGGRGAREEGSQKHLQRSIDKLVAAKEQLPEEEGREVAQGITESIKALQLQKDGLMSVTARRKRPLHNSRSRKKRSNPSGKLCSRRKRPWRTRGRYMLRHKRHVQARSRKSKKRKTKTKSVCTTRTRTSEWYNPSAHFSVDGDTGGAHGGFTDLSHSCASGENSSPGRLGSGCTVASAADLGTSVGRVEETSSFGGAIERFALETWKLHPGSRRIPTKSKEALVKEQESNQVVNSAEDAANAFKPFQITSERHKPY